MSDGNGYCKHMTLTKYCQLCPLDRIEELLRHIIELLQARGPYR